MKPSSLRSQSVVESVRSASERHDSITSLEKPDDISTAHNKSLTNEDRRLIFVMLLSLSVIWTLYGNISTFYPPYRLEHHKSISDT